MSKILRKIKNILKDEIPYFDNHFEILSNASIITIRIEELGDDGCSIEDIIRFCQLYYKTSGDLQKTLTLKKITNKF